MCKGKAFSELWTNNGKDVIELRRLSTRNGGVFRLFTSLVTPYQISPKLISFVGDDQMLLLVAGTCLILRVESDGMDLEPIMEGVGKMQ
jgi:hypothetical protein